MATPKIVLQQAAAAAAANNTDESEPLPQSRTSGNDAGTGNSSHSSAPSLESSNPPPFEDAGAQSSSGSTSYSRMVIDQAGLETRAQVEDDGRVSITITQKNKKISNILLPALRRQLDQRIPKAEKEELPVPIGLGGDQLPVPSLNIVIQIVGSRGDVQPYVALGQLLKSKYGHRVRLATHPTFREFVVENGLEFFSIGGDPAELMAFMVKNPGLMPGMDTLRSGDVGQRRKAIYEMITGCWRSCIEAGDGTGPAASDDLLASSGGFESFTRGHSDGQIFIADAIIANPPSFAHVHIAEKLGIPLHLTFTMPWSPTQSFPHPLANIVSTNAESAMTSFLSYGIVEMLTWQGLGDLINRFRSKTLGLEPVPMMWAPGMISRLKIPYTYCWSPALIPKPKDWSTHIDISGFYFLDLASNYTPPQDLKDFLDSGPPPFYIGFGSIVVDDPNALTKIIFDAVRKTGQRALVSKGWGGFGADQIGIPEGVFMLGNCPHDWLFKRVSCVVHHGGAGTTAAGIRAGSPTVIVPFFGDQPFWGAMVARAGAGPTPIPHGELNADRLAEAITFALKPESLERAAELSAQIRHEDGTGNGAKQFHQHLKVDALRCSLAPDRVAVWQVNRTNVRLSAFAATVLGNEGLIEFSDLRLHRPYEYAVQDGPWDPISGGASALLGTITNISMGVADFPIELLRSLKIASTETKERRASQSPETSSTSTHKDGKLTMPSQKSSGSLTPPAIASTGAASDLSAKDADEGSASAKSRSDSDAIRRPISPRSASPSPSTANPLHGGQIGNGSRSHSRSGSQDRRADSSTTTEGQWTLGSMVEAGKGVSKIVGEGLKSPMDFTMGLAQGFHNAPKLYGDDTVRRTEKVTGFQSGLKAAGREFIYGFSDGISGLATQPMRAMEKEGPSGLAKGFAKGIGGLILKPGAAVWGLPGYTMKGIYAEVMKVFGASTQNYIIAARTAEGYEAWKTSTPDQRAQVITIWKNGHVELRRKGKPYIPGKAEAVDIDFSQHEELPHGYQQTKHMSFDERKKLAEEKKRRKQAGKTGKVSVSKVNHGCKLCTFDHGDEVEHVFKFPNPKQTDAQGKEFEMAIQNSVAATSTGDPEEDRMIARALRASMTELQIAQEAGDFDSALDRAVAASIAEANRARVELRGQLEEAGSSEDTADHDEELSRALKESLIQYQRQHGSQIPTPPPRSPKPFSPQPLSDRPKNAGGNDEDLQKAIEESKRSFIPPGSKEKSTSADTASNRATTSPVTSASRATEAPTVTSTNTTISREDSHDEEAEQGQLSRALDESKKAHEAFMNKQKTEEEIVMEYVKKQSLLEEEHRQRRTGESKEQRK